MARASSIAAWRPLFSQGRGAIFEGDRHWHGARNDPSHARRENAAKPAATSRRHHKAFLACPGVGGEQPSRGGALQQAFDGGAPGIVRRQCIIVHHVYGPVESMRRLDELALTEADFRQRRRRLPENSRAISFYDQRQIIVEGRVLRHQFLRRGKAGGGQPALRRNDITAAIRIADDGLDLRLRRLIRRDVDRAIEGVYARRTGVGEGGHGC
ncbi:hypothetical protein [Methylocella tundrae]|uniref:hypothetical protein n=1 Tax=Methylocella tundrae TaxID=227605 RepID=UPI003CC7EC23